jgi:hypothetical protein
MRPNLWRGIPTPLAYRQTKVEHGTDSCGCSEARQETQDKERAFFGGLPQNYLQ